MNTEPWHVLQVMANHEKRVAQHLTARDIHHYLPLYAERSRWSDRSVVIERPLFSGYVFAHVPSRGRTVALSTPGVIRLLGEHDTDMVSAEEIEQIREGLRSGYVLRPHPCISVGMHVRVRSGIFDGVEGVVTELRQQCKVVLRLTAIQQCFSLQMDMDDVEIVRPHLAYAAQPAMVVQ